MCDRVRGRERESETEMISDEKRKMQKEKPAAQMTRKGFQSKWWFNSSEVIQRLALIWISGDAGKFTTLHRLMDKTDPDKKKRQTQQFGK